MRLSLGGFLCGRRWIEYFVLVAGVFCLGNAVAKAGRYQTFEQTAIASAHAPKVTQLEIPRIGLSVAVLEGDTKENMALGAVHLTDTAALGSDSGNAAIAGHRDSAFRRLGEVRGGDEIVVRGETDFVYRVMRTRIVSADDTAALADDGQARLTLITCYPFHYVGSAPRRFLVEAERVGRRL